MHVITHIYYPWMRTERTLYGLFPTSAITARLPVTVLFRDPACSGTVAGQARGV
jgi:hypothetical protein